MLFFCKFVFLTEYTSRSAQLGRVLDLILKTTKGSFRFYYRYLVKIVLRSVIIETLRKFMRDFVSLRSDMRPGARM